MSDSDPQLSEGLVDAALRLAAIGRDVTDDLTPEQLRASARAWHEIAELVEQCATDEEVATVARATVYRDQYSETTYLRVQIAELERELAEARTVTDAARAVVEAALRDDVTPKEWAFDTPAPIRDAIVDLEDALTVLSSAPVEGGER